MLRTPLVRVERPVIVPVTRREAARGVRHVANVESVVSRYSPRLWERVLALRLKRLRRIVRAIGPRLELLVLPEEVQQRAEVPEDRAAIEYIENLIREIETGVSAEDLGPALEGLSAEIGFGYGFLPNEPRLETLLREVDTILGNGLSQYWANVADPGVLARDIYAYKAQGLKDEKLYNALAGKYRGEFYSAERLVRTVYTGGANRAAYEAIRAEGYTGKKWLSAKDSRTRPGKTSSIYNHRVLDGMVVPVEEPFVSPTSGAQMRFPGDTRRGAPGGEVYNCRCTVIGVMLEPGKKAVAKPDEYPDQGRKGGESPQIADLPDGAAIRKQLADLAAKLEREKERLEGQIETRIKAAEAEVERLKPAARPDEDWNVDQEAVKRLSEAKVRLYDLKTERQRARHSITERLREEVLYAPDAARVDVDIRIRKGKAEYEGAVEDFARLVGPGVIDRAERGVEMKYKKGARAYHLTYRAHGSRSLVLMGSPSRGTVVHELGHYLEDMIPTANEMAIAFRERRTVGEDWVRLNKLRPGWGYGSHEVVKPDNFVDPYVGKKYSGDRSSEIISMGLERMYRDPLKFAQDDPGHFDLTWDVIRYNRAGVGAVRDTGRR